MRPPIMRRLPLHLLLAVSCLASLPSTASAQDALGEPAVRLTLLSQTPWNSSFDPERTRELALRFRADNLGTEPIDEISIGVTLYARVLSRTGYQSSLVTDPSIVIEAETLASDEVIEPGGSHEFAIEFPLDSADVDPDNSGVYPLKVDLRSGFVSLAAIRTPVVFLVREPEEPLVLSWTFVLHHGIAFGPDGVFTSTDLEVSLAPGGRLAAQVTALLGLASDPSAPAVDVAISPVLLTQLDRMRDGYELRSEADSRTVAPGEGAAALAADALEDLRSIAAAPNVQVTALPFSSPELPSLVSGGLGRDVDEQMARGREVVATLLETTPVSTVLRPPGAAIDAASLQALGRRGVSTIVAGPSTVEPTPHPLGFAGAPTARFDAGDGVVAIVPEPTVMSLLQSEIVTEDPILAGHVLLGELATVWQEQPGLKRGIALVVSEDLLAPPGFYGALTRQVAAAPWVAPMHADEFASLFAPTEPSELTAPFARRFPSDYVDGLRQARRRIGTYRSLLASPSDEPDRFETLLLLAESREFLSSPNEGTTFVAEVADSVEAVFGAVSVDAPDEVTLTSSSGAGIPVTLTNAAEDALRVDVRLVSTHLRRSESRDLELAPGASQTVTFPVDVRSTGRFEVELSVLAPDGTFLTGRQLVVRSTVYNRIALFITVAAAVVLLGLWARRFLPRRTS
jgi:hypothetical protein